MSSIAPRHKPVSQTAQVEGNRQATRAMPTNSTAWRSIRAEKLGQNAWCECCLRRGCPRCCEVPRPANQVDHIDGNDSNNAPSNHQSLCAPCHSRKTATENGGFGTLQILPRWLPRPACRLVVVCGPPGAGKSTHVAKHAGARDVVLDTDRIAMQRYNRPLHELSRPELANVFSIRNRLLADLSRAVPTSVAWLIATAGTYRQRKFWADLGAEVLIIFPGAQECIARVNADQTRDESRKRSSIEAIKRWV